MKYIIVPIVIVLVCILWLVTIFFFVWLYKGHIPSPVMELAALLSAMFVAIPCIMFAGDKGLLL